MADCTYGRDDIMDANDWKGDDAGTNGCYLGRARRNARGRGGGDIVVAKKGRAGVLMSVRR